MSDPLPPAPRTVKPRKRVRKRLPIVTINGGNVLFENGEVDSEGMLIMNLPIMPSTLFVKLAAADWIAGDVNGFWSERDPDHWQWRAAPQERDVHRPDGVKVASRVGTVIHFFGFKGGVYHKLIDPVTMYGRDLDDIWPTGDAMPLVLTNLMSWATQLRDFCYENQIDVRPTIGSMAAQLLTDRRFYPNARRKVPKAINLRVRDELPGNHYALSVMPTPDREFTAYYLDQSRAHHYHARTTALPDANTLYAYGQFTDPKDPCFEEVSDGFHGLYCLDLCAPSSQLHDWQKPGKQFVFTNELPHLLDMGYTVNGVYAAWGSYQRDTGLALYAQWAESQLNRFADAPWLKPLLLATYGTLAVKARYGEAVFRLAKAGEPVSIVTGHNQLHGKMVRSRHKLEPRIANVMHRGMIEAATRSESVGLAQWLESEGHRVLSIYADAVIVQQDDENKSLPLLPEPWRIKTELNHLQFINQQAFMSGEMTKLPGVGRELIAYRQQNTGKAPRTYMRVEAMTNADVPYTIGGVRKNPSNQKD